jgi:hypothetical protein
MEGLANSSNDSVLCEVVNEHTIKCGGEEFVTESSLYQASSWLFWVYLILYILLVLFAGI